MSDDRSDCKAGWLARHLGVEIYRHLLYGFLYTLYLYLYSGSTALMLQEPVLCTFFNRHGSKLLAKSVYSKALKSSAGSSGPPQTKPQEVSTSHILYNYAFDTLYKCYSYVAIQRSIAPFSLVLRSTSKCRRRRPEDKYRNRTRLSICRT